MSPSRPPPGDRVYNLSAGPSTLPAEVLMEARDDLWSVMGSGIGVLGHSHRGEVYDGILEQTIRDWREVGGIPEEYECLFIQGGATLQMAMIPMNFLGAGGSIADYFDTGRWARDSIAEARTVGRVHVACSSANDRYARVPEESERVYTPGASYLHYCENNTVFGTHVDRPQAPPGVPIVCDASSSIFSRSLDVRQFDMIYGGAQKNLGPSGCAFVIIKRSFLDRARRDLPSMLRYDIHAQHESRYNTPNTFAVYLMGKVFRWIQSIGGLPGVHALNLAKAKVLYGYLDRSELFRPTVVNRRDRSLVNVTFRTASPETDARFCREAELAGLSGLRGHPENGGMRASMYNAFPLEGAQRLVEFMAAFEASALGRRSTRVTPWVAARPVRRS